MWCRAVRKVLCRGERPGGAGAGPARGALRGDTRRKICTSGQGHEGPCPCVPLTGSLLNRTEPGSAFESANPVRFEPVRQNAGSVRFARFDGAQ